MRVKLILVMLMCALGPGLVALTGCKEEKKSMSPASTLLLLNAAQPTYFPVIPKGVAQE